MEEVVDYIANNYVVISLIFMLFCMFMFGFIFGFIKYYGNNVIEDLKSLNYDEILEENRQLKRSIEIVKGG